jgi:hypothetical protein
VARKVLDSMTHAGIGVFMPGDENDPEQKRRLSALIQALADLGWTDGRNVRCSGTRPGVRPWVPTIVAI